jgi:hypothetical protein
MCRKGRKDRNLNYVIEVARTVNHTMYFNGSPTDDIECKVGFDDKDTITGIFELVIPWYATKKWVSLKIGDALVKFINKGCCIGGAVICNPVED